MLKLQLVSLTLNYFNLNKRKQKMEIDELKKYNEWHSKQSTDSNLKAIWHIFACSQIQILSLKGKKILEIGCGRGGFACWLSTNYSHEYSEFIAADFSEMGIKKGKEYAEKHGYLKITWSIQDIMKINFPSEYFDVVISCETIEHVPDTKQAIKELYRVLKSSGILILTTPNYFNFFGLYRIYLRLIGKRWTEGGQPINQFMMFFKTKNMLKKVGFKILKAETQDISYPSPIKKRQVSLNWNFPKWLIRYIGLSSFFVAKK